jgi:REP element-mobilizing transposase RayT
MPRAARLKDPRGIYHVMAKSISEFNLFQDDDDKEYYLDLLKRYKEKFKCKVYGYCLMTNHAHMQFDPCGFDISKFMHCLNLAYVRYINIKYNRKGHLFAERFQSKIITDMCYNLLVSAYIHNNPSAIAEYRENAHEYPYSSMGIYTGKQLDTRNLIDTEFILSCINENNKNEAKKQYLSFVAERRDMGTNNEFKEYMTEFENEKYSRKYKRTVFLRDKDPKEVIKHIAQKLGVSDISSTMRKWQREAIEFKAIATYSLNLLCGLSYVDICKIMNNISQSHCSQLCKKGFAIIESGVLSEEIFRDLIKID